MYPFNDRPFPTVHWPEMGVKATFLADPERLVDSDPFAVIAFAWTGDRFLLANVAGRGWCTPSGRVEPGETSAGAAVRECVEETGAHLLNLVPLGVYRLQPEHGNPTVVAAYVGFALDWEAGFTGPQSTGIGAFLPEELPSVYYRWDELLEAVFALAGEVARREFGRENAR